ncbi:MAG: hypothetical protein ABS87_07160 [Sphingomonas sp. SCN 67-18]|uniref:PEPxxWA-CTERM sorting domain-containing protein n=1 Tax=uncultured Sphingomonas sp. TaxID=158754 RepID=UPI00086D9C99|nr:PEPxxWA-CTERM sorting domain-containing protein [Sphingomonas sp. SCN 67-18]ODU21332.1 MAG: hypothetical protein ABS87_07160 [Sphingomonas sp. SCN 67-18]
MRKFALAAAAAFAAVTLPGAASASVTITSYVGDPGFLTGTLHYTTANKTQDVGIGRFHLTGTEQPGNTAVDYFTYCADILNNIHTGSFDLISGSAFITDAAKRGQIITLLSNTNPLLAAATGATAKNISAATQMAIWEVLYETSGTYSLSGGNLFITGGNSAAARTLADTYLANLSGLWTNDGSQQLSVLYAKKNQSQIFLSAVPEPATWAMMIGGFGLVGGAMRRSRRKAAMPVLA